MLKVDAVIVMRFGVGLTDDERSIVWSNKDEERRAICQICKIGGFVRKEGKDRTSLLEKGRKQLN